MGHFLCVVDRLKRFVNVHLHCVISNQKRISKMLTLPPAGKISADAHVYKCSDPLCLCGATGCCCSGTYKSATTPLLAPVFLANCVT